MHASEADLPLSAPSQQRLLRLGASDDPAATALQRNLSALAGRDDWLWMGGDEGRSLFRLEGLDNHQHGDPSRVKLADFGLAEGKEQGESDIEGLALDGDRLWLVGSHSSRRYALTSRKGEPLSLPAESRRNAHVLGCLHLDGKGWPRSGQRLQPARKASRDALSKALAADPRLAPFIAIPSKDNGLDIEGVTARGERVLVGLRGPVLRGIALVADLRLAGLSATSGETLTLESLRLRALQLSGLAVRDLAAVPGSPDVIVLAGPTMTLPGPCFLYRWRDALHPDREAIARGEGSALVVEEPEPQLCIREGRPGRGGEGDDKPEGLHVAQQGDQLMAWVAYDDPSTSRREGDGACTRLAGFALP
jgi:hypothetical protein